MKEHPDGTYIFDPETEGVIPVPYWVWAMWLELNTLGAKYNVIARDEITDSIRVSTIFLGLDHSFGEAEEPVLFETMIFGDGHDSYQVRYTSLEAARKGHEDAVRAAKALAETGRYPDDM